MTRTITVTPIWDSAIRTRKKDLTSKDGHRTALITAEHHSNPQRTRWEVSICSANDERTRTNENNDDEPTNDTATDQLHEARIEYQDYLNEEAQKLRRESDGKQG